MVCPEHLALKCYKMDFRLWRDLCWQPLQAVQVPIDDHSSTYDLLLGLVSHLHFLYPCRSAEAEIGIQAPIVESGTACELLRPVSGHGQLIAEVHLSILQSDV